MDEKEELLKGLIKESRSKAPASFSDNVINRLLNRKSGIFRYKSPISLAKLGLIAGFLITIITAGGLFLPQSSFLSIEYEYNSFYDYITLPFQGISLSWTMFLLAIMAGIISLVVLDWFLKKKFDNAK